MPSSAALQRLLGTRLVADHGERRAELGLRQRRREAVEPGVGVVAQLADRRAAVAGEHIERIGTPLAAALEVLRVADEVRQPVERLVEGPLAHGVAGLLGPRQEVGDVAGQPHVAVATAPRCRTRRRQSCISSTRSMAPSMRSRSAASVARPMRLAMSLT